MSEPGSEKINSPRSYSEECRARARAYLHQRGVLESTFIAHGGEIDPLVGRPTIAERLKRHIDGVCRDGAWNKVDAILWFKVSNFNGENVHWLARPLPRFKNCKFLATDGSDGIPWIPEATRDVAKDVGVPIIFTEGPIEVLVLIQAGAFPIGLMGAWAAATSKRKAAPPAPLELDQFESAELARCSLNVKRYCWHGPSRAVR